MGLAKKHVPIRMCIICRTRMEKYKLNRYVLIDRKFILDEKQRLPGRGFYVCNNLKCKNIAEKKFLKEKRKIFGKGD